VIGLGIASPYFLAWGFDGVFGMTGGRGLHALQFDGVFGMTGGRGLHALQLVVQVQPQAGGMRASASV